MFMYFAFYDVNYFYNFNPEWNAQIRLVPDFLLLNVKKGGKHQTIFETVCYQIEVSIVIVLI